MKVLFYDQFSLAFGGGGEVWLAHVAQHFAKRGVDVTVMTSSRAGSGVKPASPSHLISEEPLFRIIQLKTFTAPLGFPVPYPEELPKFLHCLETADVIYFLHEMPLVELVALLLTKRKTKTKIIAVYEGPLNTQMAFLRFFTQAAAKMMIRLGIYDAHHVLNTADEKLLRSFGARNVRVIPNGANLLRFRPHGKQEFDSVFEVLFVGRLSHQKGFDIFCEIVEMVNSRLDSGKSVKFVVIGSGELETSLRELTRNHGNVEHIPYVPHREMPGHYAPASVLVAPYRYEGQPLAVVEAQACGLPVVAAALPGISETLIDGQTGEVVRSGNAEDFVEPILRYYNRWSENREWYQSIREKARKNSLRFGWDTIAELMIRFIGEVVAET